MTTSAPRSPRIFVDIEPLDAVVDLAAALEPGSALVHDELGNNISAHVVQRKGSYEAAIAEPSK